MRYIINCKYKVSVYFLYDKPLVSEVRILKDLIIIHKLTENALYRLFIYRKYLYIIIIKSK